MAKIICMGIAVADILVKGCGRESYNEELYLAEDLQIIPGGDAFNEAVILTRLGNEVKLLCGVGQDAAGEMMLARGRQEGVDMSAVTVNPEIPTSIFVLLVDDKGERKCISRIPSGQRLFEPDPETIKGADIVSLASLFRPPFDRPEALLQTVKKAKEEQALICADIKMSDGRMKLKDLGEGLAYVDYMFPNEAEARFHTGKDTVEEMAEEFLKLGIRHVVIKLGRRGCYACSAEERFLIPSFEVEAVDSTGAGDNFASGFMTALAEGKSFRECCLFASAVAAVSVQSIGATSGVTDRAKIERFLSDRTEV